MHRLGVSRRFCIVADCKGGIERNTLRKAACYFWIDINNPTDSVVGRTKPSLHIWSDCRRPIPVPVRKLPVRPQGSSIFQDLSRSGQRTHAIIKSQLSSAAVSAAVTPTGVYLPCGIRTNHDNFTKETDIIFIFCICQKVSLLQRFFGSAVQSKIVNYREMSRKRVEMPMGILRPSEQNTMFRRML